MIRKISYTLLLVLTLYILLISPSSALLNASEILPDIMATGFDTILRSQADNMKEMAGMNESINQTVMMANSIIVPNNFMNNTFIVEQNGMSKYFFTLCWVFFVFFGGIKLMKEISSEHEQYGKKHQWRNTYLTIALGSLIFYKTYPWIFGIVFDFEYALSYGMFLNTMDNIQTGMKSGTDYFVSTILDIILYVFGRWRYFVIAMICSGILLLFILRFLMIESIFKAIIYTGLVLLFGRTAIVAVMWIGSGVLSNMPKTDLGYGLLYDPNNNMNYTIILGIAALIAIILILFPIVYLIFGRKKEYVII
jgi:hypothetical protein